MVITLKEDTKTLDEVVVVGYQEVRRRDLTGSVAKANMADVLTAPVASFDQALGRTYRRSQRNFGRRYAGRQHEHRDPW